MKLVCGLCGGQLAIGTVMLAIAGGPIGGILVFGSLAGFGLYMAFAGDD